MRQKSFERDQVDCDIWMKRIWNSKIPQFSETKYSFCDRETETPESFTAYMEDPACLKRNSNFLDVSLMGRLTYIKMFPVSKSLEEIQMSQLPFVLEGLGILIRDIAKKCFF